MFAILPMLVLAVGEGLAKSDQVPDPPAAPPPEFSERVDLFLSWLKWGGLVAGVGGLTACGVMMIIGQRNRHALSADGAAGVPWVFAGISLVATAASLVSAFL